MKNLNHIIEEAISVIAKGNLKTAFREINMFFQTLTKYGLEDEEYKILHRKFVALSGEFRTLSKKERLRLSDDHSIDTSRNSIRERLLDLCDELKKEAMN